MSGDAAASSARATFAGGRVFKYFGGPAKEPSRRDSHEKTEMSMIFQEETTLENSL